MLQLVVLSRGFRFPNAILQRTSIQRQFASKISETYNQRDSLITGLNGAQDITVKVLSCKNLLQEMMRRNDLSPLATKYMGELVTCSLMMGAGLKGEESLQLNLVGDRGIKNIIAITNGNLEVRGSVGNTQFGKDTPDVKEVHPSDLLGNGEVQIVRNHPAWKHPMNGITEIRETSIATNLALYMVESEQRPSAIITDVQVEGGKVISALGLMVETLPGALPENVETSIANLEAVQKKGLYSYIANYVNEQNVSLTNSASLISNNQSTDTESKSSMSTLSGGELTSDERHRAESLFASLDSPLDRILDDCLVSMDTGSIRWDKEPTFKCTCGVDKVWRALKLLGKAEVEDIIAKQEDVKMKCELCGEKYVLTCQEIKGNVLIDENAKPL
eukprot:gene24346-27540_t